MYVETDDFEDTHAETELVFQHLTALSQLVSELVISCFYNIRLRPPLLRLRPNACMEGTAYVV
jgi:hypothetical protein